MGNHCTIAAEKETDLPTEVDKAADPRWRVLPTEERLQLGRFTEGLAPLFDRVLALQTVAQERGVR